MILSINKSSHNTILVFARLMLFEPVWIIGRFVSNHLLSAHHARIITFSSYAVGLRGKSSLFLYTFLFEPISETNTVIIAPINMYRSGQSY